MIPISIKHKLWHTKALAETIPGNYAEGAALYREARLLDTKTPIAGDALVRELEALRTLDCKQMYIDVLKSWTPLERITWLIWNYSNEGDIRQAHFRDCAASLGEGEFIVSVYQEAIQFFGHYQCKCASETSSQPWFNPGFA